MGQINRVVPDGMEKINVSKSELGDSSDGVVEEIAAKEFPEEARFGMGRFLNARTVLISVIALIVVIVLALAPVYFVYLSAKRVYVSGQELYEAMQNQNIGQIKFSLAKTKEDITSFEDSLVWVSHLKVVPFVGAYVKDAENAARGAMAGLEAGELMIMVAEPYSDLLGLNGGEVQTDGAKTAEDRIDFIVRSVGDVLPQLGPISEKMDILASEVNKIDPGRYPEVFQGREVRSNMRRGIELVNQIQTLVSGGRPVLEQLPYLIGTGEERRYLFLWQNDKELRPTGGFITAYSIVAVEDGKFKPVTSNDIYNLDNRFNSKIPAPQPIREYLSMKNWHLRDMNLSPDFKASMETFFENYKKAGAPRVDGIVAVDTELVVDLLEVIGPIGVPGYGNFSARQDSRCSCPVVIYELESYADVAGPVIWDDISGKIILKPANYDNRKAILGPLMNSVLANAMGQPKEKLPDLFRAGWNALLEKHVLFYFEDEEIQAAMESFNLAGRIEEYDGDYLHVNDANFAGAKSNLYVEHEVDLAVERGGEGTINTLTLRYKNPQKWDGWLNGPFRDWVRVYVPQGSELLESVGSEEEVVVTEDLGKTTFTGFFTLRPEGVIELTFKYKTPVQMEGEYKIKIQKQPGTKGHLYRVNVDGESQEFRLLTDKELRF